VGLPQQHRLKQRQDFSQLYAKGLRLKTPSFAVRLRRRSPQSGSAEPGSRQLPTRIGISVSLKVEKRAVVRNRIRRQVQAIFRQLLPAVEPGWDILVIALPVAARCDYHQFLQELKQLLADAEVFHGC